MEYNVKATKFGEALLNPLVTNGAGERCEELANYCNINRRFCISSNALHLCKYCDEIKKIVKQFAKSHGITARTVDAMIKNGQTYSVGI